MNQTSAKMHFHNNKCAIKCLLTTEFGRKNVNLQLNDNRRLQLCNNTDINANDNECSFNLNKIITNISLLTIPSIENLKMPSKIKVDRQYSIIAGRNWPLIKFNHDIVLPITSTIPRAIRSLVIPVTNMVLHCPSNQLDPNLSSDGKEKSTNRPKYQDQINFVQTACNFLSSPEKQNDVDIGIVDIEKPLVEEAQNPNGNKSSPGQQEPVFPQGAGSKINKVLVKESSDYLSDILSLGLCTNCSENHLNCSCSHEIL